MPDRGLLEPSTIADVAFSDSVPLVLESARWLQVTFEVDRAASLALLPSDVSRPIPPYARLLIAASAQGQLALLSVGGRYRLMPRNVVVAAVASDGLLDTVRGTLGHGTVAGAVSLVRSGQEVEATVEADAGQLASVTLPGLHAVEPTMLRWDGIVATARDDGVPVLAEVVPSPEISAAFLSKGASVVLGASRPRDDPWRSLRSLCLVSACYAEGSFAFSLPQIQQPWR